MRWLIGIGSTLVALGLIIAIWAGAMDGTAATQVPDTAYSYIAITKTISVVSIDLVRVQILWFVAGAATILLGAILAAIGYLGLRLGLSPAPEPELVPVPASASAVQTPSPSPPTPEQIAEANELERRERKLLLGCGLIAVIVLVMLVMFARNLDQSAARADLNNSAEANTAMDAADDLGSSEINAVASNAQDAERAVTAKPTPSKSQPNDDESEDVDEPEVPAPSATSPAPDPSSNST